MAISVPTSLIQIHFPDLVNVARSAAYDDVAVVALLALCGASYLLQGLVWNRPDPYAYKLYERPQEIINGKPAQKATRNIAQKLKEVV